MIDPGSLTVRAGYSGEDNPKMVCTSYIGEMLEESNQATQLNQGEG